jgi:site-specific DNA recombinase
MTHVFATPRPGAQGRASHRYYRCQSDLKSGRASCPSRSLPAETIERFVVERVRAVGRDPAVLAATLDTLRRADERALAALDAERPGLERDMAEITKQIGVAAQAGRSPRAVATLADLQDREACIRTRLGEIAGLRRDLDDRRVARADLEAALGRFDEVWAELSPAEQARALRLLIRRIDFDAAAGKVAVTFHDGAPATLTTPTKQEAA